VLLEAVAAAGAPLSEVVAPYDRYAASGEINFEVDDADGGVRAVRERFAAGRRGAFADRAPVEHRADHEDGLTVVVERSDGWFNLRPSEHRAASCVPAQRRGTDDVDHLDRARAVQRVLREAPPRALVHHDVVARIGHGGHLPWVGWFRTLESSGLLRRSLGIRPSLHPARRRCSSPGQDPAVRAPRACPAGAGTLSMRQVTPVTDHQGS
jgi:hypothetical protein